MEDERRKAALLFVLNSEGHVDEDTGVRITAAIRQRLTDLVTAVKSASDALALTPPKSEAVSFNDFVGRCKQQIADINRTLAQVRLVPHVTLASTGRSLNFGEVLHIDPTITSLRELERREFKLSGTELTSLEELAILGVGFLLRQGLIDTLRRCECGEWFIATRSDQKACSATCRQRKHAGKPEFKVKRREYYRTVKKLEAKRAKAAK